MEQKNTYKYLSIVLAIVAIVFAVLYFTKPTGTVTDIYRGISDDAQMCRDKVTAWQNMHGGQATTTAQDRADLKKILDDCYATFQKSGNKI